MFGALIDKYDARDFRLKVAACSGGKILPEEFSLSYIPQVKNQGEVNSCVAHVCSSLAEYFEKIQCDSTTALSPGFIYGTRYKHIGTGMYLRDALQTLCNLGVCSLDKFPYNEEVPKCIELLDSIQLTLQDTMHCRISEYFRCASTEEIKQALVNYGPVMFSVPWYSDSKVTNSVLIKGTTMNGNHAIYIYGWDKNGFLFQNSWGKKWNKTGRCTLSYNYPINEAWGITDNCKYPHDVVIKKPERNGFIDLIYKLINFIVNLFKKHD